MEKESDRVAFEPFDFSKTWENPEDFPTYEPDEGQVRADLQLLHNETRDALNGLIRALNDTSAAAKLPFAPVEGLTAQTVQQAIEQVYAAVRDAAAGLIVDGSITKEKLEAALLKKIYGGRVWVSMDAPAAEDDPGREFPVGQIWLRPGMTIENCAGEDWEVSGGTVAKEERSWVFTADGSQDYMTASLLLQAVGTAGQQIKVLVKTGETAAGTENAMLYLEDEGRELGEGGFFETTLDQTGSLEISLHIPVAQEGACLVLEQLTAVNTDALEASLPDCSPSRSWQTLLEAVETSAAQLPMKVWMQTRPGTWEEVFSQVLPVERGGTGLASIPQGALLYGTSSGDLAVLPPVEEGVLQWSGGQPRWEAPETLARKAGCLQTKTGTYEGTGGNGDRTLQLPVEPVMLLLWPKDGSCDTACLANGGKSGDTYQIVDGNLVVSYEAKVSLAGKILTFTNERRGNYGGLMLSQHMNAEGVSYCYLAVY